MPNITEREIRALAYKLWQERGCPVNDRPEQDWTESEWQLMTEAAVSEVALVPAPGQQADPALPAPDDQYKIGPRNDYQYQISFGGEDGKLRWIDNFRVLGTLDWDILEKFHKCYPKSYGSFFVLFRTGSFAENRGEIDANAFYLDSDSAVYARNSLIDALNGAINPFAPMHRTGPDYPPYISGDSRGASSAIVVPYKIARDGSGEHLWCASMEYDPATGLWHSLGVSRIDAHTAPGRGVWAMFEKR